MRITRLLSAIIVGLAVGRWLHAQPRPPVPAEYQPFFVKYSGERSPFEWILNQIGLPGDVVGRSVAVVIGVSHYPRMSKPIDRDLKPASEDLRKLTDYLKNEEFFDDVILVKDDKLTLETLRYFLQVYVPHRLDGSRKSRFLMLYTGHGFNEGTKSYIDLSTATSVRDRDNSISLDLLKSLADEAIGKSFHSLVLLNSCNSGPFVRIPFGEATLVPIYPGAHAIAAAGTQEPAWSDPRIGSGSVFFEKVLQGIRGAADSPTSTQPSGDGIVTVDELYSFLRRGVGDATSQAQNPLLSDLLPAGSRGSFFFLRRDRPVKSAFLPTYRPATGHEFGSQTAVPLSLPEGTSAGRAVSAPDDSNHEGRQAAPAHSVRSSNPVRKSFDVRHIHNHVVWMSAGDGTLYVSAAGLEFKEDGNPAHDFRASCTDVVKSRYLNWAGPIGLLSNGGFTVTTNGKTYNLSGAGVAASEIMDAVKDVCSGQPPGLGKGNVVFINRKSENPSWPSGSGEQSAHVKEQTVSPLDSSGAPELSDSLESPPPLAQPIPEQLGSDFLYFGNLAKAHRLQEAAEERTGGHDTDNLRSKFVVAKAQECNVLVMKFLAPRVLYRLDCKFSDTTSFGQLLAVASSKFPEITWTDLTHTPIYLDMVDGTGSAMGVSLWRFASDPRHIHLYIEER
jgi:hypothetical protein